MMRIQSCGNTKGVQYPVSQRYVLVIGMYLDSNIAQADSIIQNTVEVLVVTVQAYICVVVPGRRREHDLARE